jgi:hypothetical protein
MKKLAFLLFRLERERIRGLKGTQDGKNGRFALEPFF